MVSIFVLLIVVEMVQQLDNMVNFIEYNKFIKKIMIKKKIILI